MGKYRSKSGCSTCRQRRVKCDEVKPVCGNCAKKNRDCQWATPQTKFQGYHPDTGSSSATAQTETEEVDADGDDEHVALAPSRRQRSQRTATTGQNTTTHVRPSGRATEGFQQPSTSPFLSQVNSPASTQASGGVAVPAAFSTALPK
ncbi:uncharacterized protein N0V89_009789 [Didymosphaeria variabile]|uniref:Zn(2)-C6 fungal-type domain-containing protein n=1 Tax=Didymosphaeria variabile TaxID=1932322 RepID=A0A9W8XEF0_9PLEO|nr:uncharacterized protein N0V89_009789 [Didymosphaeria variabile]KAJ4348415.1 hypothetical protein N0V89_009789 [Didymosphaeria variabile]